MHRPVQPHRGYSRPPSAPPPPNVTLKRKERDYEQDAGDETNINVVVRCRGRNEREVRENSGVVVSTTGVKGKNVELSMGPNALSNKTYQFDKVFSPAADQAIIFDDVVLPILSEMLAGYNCTIFAYGQTGTGKTYTMSGDMTESCGLLTDAAGIIPRVLQSLFQKLEAEGAECSVKCSFIELYNEELRDLLSAEDSTKLKIYDDTNKKGSNATVVQGMEESHVSSAAEGIAKLQQGSLRRQVAATKCNDLSSRSHTVFTITTYVKKPGGASDDYICSGKLNLVDLAGSENIQRSGAENKRATEAGLINKSLLTLGRVINALVDKSSHIPYRESKLTRLLQDSLGGRTKTCIIATVSPSRSNLEETISTLDYAFRAKNIRNKPQINAMMSKKTLLKEFTAEIEKLKGELIATRQRNGVYLSNEKFEEMTIESESRRILSEEQKARIETMEASLRNKVQELFSLTNNFTTLKKGNETTWAALESTKDILQKTEIALSHTKATLEAESELRQRYATTEDKLYSISKGLVSTLGDSLHDIDGLNSKLRRRSELHNQNYQKWEKVRGTGNATITSIEDNLELLEQEHNAALEATSQRVERFVTAELERVQQAQCVLNQSLEVLGNRTESAKAQSSDARDSMNEVLEEIGTLRDDVKLRVGAGLNGLSDAAAKISGEVISELGQFHSQLHASYSGLGKEVKAVFDDLSKQLQAQREESDRLRSALQEANRRNLQVSLDAASQLEATIEEERKTSEQERAQLMLQITDLIGKSSCGRNDRFSSILTSTQANLVEAAEHFETADKTYGEGMENWTKQDSNIREKLTKSKDDIKNRFKKDWSAVSEKNGKIQDSTKAVHGETINIVNAQVQEMAVQMTALDDFVVRAKEQNNHHHDDHVTSLNTMSSQLKNSLESVQSRLGHTSLAAFNTGMKAHLDEIASTFADVEDKARVPLQQLQETLTAANLTNYFPTGHTPQKKEWTYPTELPRTLPSTTTPQATPHKSPKKSPRKQSPRKQSPKKQMVRPDSPVQQHPQQQLRELDVNVVAPVRPVAAAAVIAVKELKENDGGREMVKVKEKESIVPVPVKSASFYAPRMTRSSAARMHVTTEPPDIRRTNSASV